MSRPTRATAAGRAYLDLQNRARQEGRGTQELLVMYVIERWLARLARSPYIDDFVLKGGMLLASYGSRRTTVDADALARHLPATQEAVARRIAEVAAIPNDPDHDDGVEFLTGTTTTTPIRDDAPYSGIRVVMEARIATAQVKLRLDISFGDPVVPAPRLVTLPSLRTDTAPVMILGYPLESVLAEKLATAIELGQANTRIRDYVDIFRLTGDHDFTAEAIVKALRATTGYRGTELVAMSTAIGRIGVLRRSDYLAYRRNLGPDAAGLPGTFAAVLAAVVAFADPLMGPTAGFRWVAAERRWES